MAKDHRPLLTEVKVPVRPMIGDRNVVFKTSSSMKPRSCCQKDGGGFLAWPWAPRIQIHVCPTRVCRDALSRDLARSLDRNLDNSHPGNGGHAYVHLISSKSCCRPLEGVSSGNQSPNFVGQLHPPPTTRFRKSRFGPPGVVNRLSRVKNGFVNQTHYSWSGRYEPAHQGT